MEWKCQVEMGGGGREGQSGKGRGSKGARERERAGGWEEGERERVSEREREILLRKVELVTYSSRRRLQGRSFFVITSLLHHYCRFENVPYSIICQSELPC